MSYEIYLNGSLVASPKDWDGYEQEIVRDYKKRFLRIAYPGTFTLTNESGAPALRALFEADICTIVRFEAYEVCGSRRYQIVNGYVVATDCEWNINDCTVEIEVQDDAIGARVDNNVRIPVSPMADKSKNGTAITPCQFLDIEVFDPSDPVGDYLSPTRRMFDWLEAMEHCLRYMTDSNVEVVSEWYDDLPVSQKIAICNGYQLRTGDTSDNAQRLTYDFNTIWLEVAKRYNLWISVRRNDAGDSYLAIEPEATMFSDTRAFDLLHQYDLIQSIDIEQMYSSVVVGDEEGIQNLDLQYSLPYLVLQGFSEERFHFQGVCNVDEVLDLTGKWHADTNTIEKVLVVDPTSDDYDKDTFLIQYNSYSLQATKGAYLQPLTNPYLYNEEMLNVNILNRYTLPSDVGAYYNSQDSGFRASGGASGGWGVITSPSFGCFYFPFGVGGLIANDVTTPPNNNADGNWDIALQRFTAPVQGYYEFGAYVEITLDTTGLNTQAGVRVTFSRYNSSNVLLGTVVSGAAEGFINGTYQGVATGAFVLDAGDYVTRTYERYVCSGTGSPRTATIQVLGHYTETIFIAAGGGVLTSVDPTAARIVKYEFDRIMPISQWQELVNDPRLGVGVTHTANSLRECHIMKANRDVVSGKTRFTLIAKRSTI
ncbi:MAG: hypothetical protein E6Q97_32330 [Desulfurellales bacterium]|nr:MAG: hypothetical protein E6Q97_32330 [Desulfurellales bacterium]